MLDLPAADEWFARQGVGHDITRIDEPHVHPLLRCNVWHVRGRDRDLVIDTALGLHPLRAIVEEETGSLNLTASGSGLASSMLHADFVDAAHPLARRAARAPAAPQPPLTNTGRSEVERSGEKR